MSKNNVQIDLRNLNLVFDMLNIKYKIMKFYPSKMTLDVEVIDTKDIINIPFAHLPKKIKKLIKPN